MKEEQNNRPPRRHGPGSVVEKPKNFKRAVKRLVKSLSRFKILIVISLFLAMLGSILSIMAPNKLSNLTDEISTGLMVDKKVVTKLSKEIMENVALSTSSAINENELTFEQKQILINALTTKDLTVLSGLPDSVLNKVIRSINFSKTKISGSDQIKYINIISEFKSSKKIDSNKLYKRLKLLPKSIKKAISPTMNINKIKSISLFLALLYVFSALFTYIQSFIMATLSNRFAQDLRGNISKKINLLALNYFDTHKIGDILSRVTNDVDTMAQSMNQSLATLVSSVTLFIGTTIMMFYTNFVMSITAIVASLIGFILMALILRNSQRYFKERQEELGNLNAHIEEVYSGLNVVKVYNAKDNVTEEFNNYNKKVYEANKKSQFLSGLMPPLMGFIGNFGYVAVCIVGALLVTNNKISFGVIVAFITYVRLFTSPLSQIAQAMTSLQSAAAASERVFDFIDYKEMEKEVDKIKLKKEDIKGKVEFKDVVFTYEGNNEATIKGFNANISPGQKVAIVGPTGAGKTTIVNLLMKFYDIDSGDIVIDGVSINDISRENIHELFTMVLQDTWLFEGSILDNIVYNRKNVSKEAVEEVCKKIGLDHYIKTLSYGYDTIIEDSDSISLGERQLLTIARGMIENAPFLILDEATSNVDTRTEELVQTAMDKLTEGRTSFIIAHRLSTIRNADIILVVKDGNIVEQGNHDSLMKNNGFYAELYNSQFEL